MSFNDTCSILGRVLFPLRNTSRNHDRERVVTIGLTTIVYRYKSIDSFSRSESPKIRVLIRLDHVEQVIKLCTSSFRKIKTKPGRLNSSANTDFFIEKTTIGKIHFSKSNTPPKKIVRVKMESANQNSPLCQFGENRLRNATGKNGLTRCWWFVR